MTWMQEIRRPANLISIVIGLIGIIVGAIMAAYFYYKGERLGKIAYLVEQVEIFDKTRVGTLPITVLDRNGRPIDEENVYASSVTAWNSGSGEIRREDVREPLKVVSSTELRVLDVALASATRNNVDKFGIDLDQVISWEHFDPGEGFKISLIYSAPAKAAWSLQGYVVNTGGLINYSQVQVDLVNNKKNALVWLGAATIITVIVLPILFYVVRKRGGRLSRLLVILYFAAITFNSIDLVLWYFYPPIPSAPPL